MLSARPGPLNPGATSPLSRHHLTCLSRAAGSFFGPRCGQVDIAPLYEPAPREGVWGGVKGIASNELIRG
jgi:hypothetical protein